MKSIFYENRAFGEKIFKFFIKNKTRSKNPPDTIQKLSYSDFISNSNSFFLLICKT